MDTKISEIVPRQEGAISADLLQLEPHVERLSGAQRRKLRRERKKREGTWTEKKPPRNTPSFQDKSVGQSSGGVKRHSDSSTPSLEKQQPKKPMITQVQIGSYKEAVVGFKVAIIHKRHPDIKLDKTQFDMIQEKLLTAVDANPLGETPPQFLHSKFSQGVFWITCANKSSKAWLIQTISGLGELCVGTELTVIDSEDLLKRPSVLVHIPDTSDVTTVMTRLRIQNPELNTTDWSIMSRKVIEKEQTLALSIDPDSFKALTVSNFKAFWGFGRVSFHILKDDKINPQTESTVRKSPPR
jgi:hypothetical protein